MPVMLKKITTVSVTGASCSTCCTAGRAVIVNPNLPYIVFDQPTSTLQSAGLINGNTGSNPGLLGAFGVTLRTMPALDLSSYSLFGGEVCGQASCSSQCGPWLGIVNKQTYALTTSCTIIPSNPVTAGLYSLLLDTVNQYLIMVTKSANKQGVVFLIIPFSQLPTLLQGQWPSTSYYVYAVSNVPSMWALGPAAVIHDNYIYVTVSFNPPVGNAPCPYGYGYWKIPLSQLYSMMQSGVPSSSSTPVQIGSAYQTGTVCLSQPNGYIWKFKMGTKVFLGITAWASTNQQSFTAVDPATDTVIKSQLVNVYSSQFIHVNYGNIWISGSTVGIGIFDPVSGDVYNIPVSGSTLMLDDNGYIAVTDRPVTYSNYNVTVYQVEYIPPSSLRPVVLNPVITVMQGTVIATGAVYSLTTGTGLVGVTVKLVAETSGVVVGTAVTDSSARFTIVGKAVPNATAYQLQVQL